MGAAAPAEAPPRKFDDDAKYLCDRLKQASDDYTKLGRWGWGLTIAFLTQILIETAKEKGDLFKPLACGAKDTNEIARGFLLAIVIAALAYFYFLRDARRKIVSARTAVLALRTDIPSPALDFVIKTVPTDDDLKVSMRMRLAFFGVLFVVWAMMFDLLTSSASRAALWCMLTFN